MNDLQLMVMIAAGLVTQKGERIDDAIDKAEKVMEAVIDREFRHAQKHSGAPDKDGCYHCRMVDMVRQRQSRVQGVQGIVS